MQQKQIKMPIEWAEKMVDYLEKLAGDDPQYEDISGEYLLRFAEEGIALKDAFMAAVPGVDSIYNEKKAATAETFRRAGKMDGLVLIMGMVCMRLMDLEKQSLEVAARSIAGAFLGMIAGFECEDAAAPTPKSREIAYDLTALFNKVVNFTAQAIAWVERAMEAGPEKDTALADVLALHYEARYMRDTLRDAEAVQAMPREDVPAYVEWLNLAKGEDAQQG